MAGKGFFGTAKRPREGIIPNWCQKIPEYGDSSLFGPKTGAALAETAREAK